MRRGCHCGTNVAGQPGTVGARATAKALVASLGQAPQSEVSCLGPILTAARVHRSQGPPQPCCLPTMPQPRFSQEDPTDPHPSVVVAGTRQPTGGLRPSATQAVLRKQCHMQDGPRAFWPPRGQASLIARSTEGPVLTSRWLILPTWDPPAHLLPQVAVQSGHGPGGMTWGTAPTSGVLVGRVLSRGSPPTKSPYLLTHTTLNSTQTSCPGPNPGLGLCPSLGRT